MEANLGRELPKNASLLLSDEGKASCMMSMIVQLMLNLDQMHDNGCFATKDLTRNVSQLKALMRIL